MPTTKRRVEVILTEAQFEALERQRGAQSRSEYIRTALAAAGTIPLGDLKHGDPSRFHAKIAEDSGTK